MSSVNGPIITESELPPDITLEKIESVTDDNIEENVTEKDIKNSNTDNSNSSDESVLDDCEEKISDDKTSGEVEDEWLDIIGSGDFKKRVIKSGKGIETRAKQGNSVVLNYKCYKDNTLIESFEDFETFVGDLDIIPAFDLFLPLMEDGEIAEVLVPSRLAYGKAGSLPNIPPDCPLRYEVEIKKIEENYEVKLNNAMSLGEKKREKGNFWYTRGDYLNSITCYKRAIEILESIKWEDDVNPTISQSVVDARIKVYNNMAAAQIKLEAFDQALKSLDFVLRLQPKNVKAHFRKGKILAAKGLTDEAIAEMKKASDLEPDTKIIQQELTKLLNKKKVEDKTQRAMYKRMFPSSPPKPKASRIKRWLKNGSVMAGSVLALAVGVAAYRQYFS